MQYYLLGCTTPSTGPSHTGRYLWSLTTNKPSPWATIVIVKLVVYKPLLENKTITCTFFFVFVDHKNKTTCFSTFSKQNFLLPKQLLQWNYYNEITTLILQNTFYLSAINRSVWPVCCCGPLKTQQKLSFLMFLQLTTNQSHQLPHTRRCQNLASNLSYYILHHLCQNSQEQSNLRCSAPEWHLSYLMTLFPLYFYTKIQGSFFAVCFRLRSESNDEYNKH